MHTPQAWLRLDTMVVEKTDYLTGRNVRYLQVESPDLHVSPCVETPPARDNGEGHFGDGDGKRKKQGPRKASVRSSPEIITPDRLFGENSSGSMAARAASSSNGGTREGIV